MGLWSALGGEALAGAFGFLGARHSANEAEQQQERAQAWTERLQREFAQHGIQWRVEDAKRAGLHPLSVLGSTGASFSGSPVVVEDQVGPAISRMGQHIGGAISRLEDPVDREGRLLDLELRKAQIADQYMETTLKAHQVADLARNFQVANGIPTGVGSSSMIVPSGQQPSVPIQGAVDVTPPKRSTNVPSQQFLEPGYVPGFAPIQFPFGAILLPAPGGGESWSEVLENVPVWMWPSIVQLNREYYGPGRADDLARFLMARPSRSPRPRGQAYERAHPPHPPQKFDFLDSIYGRR